ncbi:hypothetical protein [Frondihabitans sucicola]|uniref:hypothetical protein n=1 Tax=Frondihabitans sucicola TaxID=1268041 RepID=UPI0025738941|nr:hypothetical protein [Frondihabitans sucicola]
MIRGRVFDLFDQSDITRALRLLGRDDPSDDAFASALWSCLVEPGDAVGESSDRPSARRRRCPHSASVMTIFVAPSPKPG